MSLISDLRHVRQVRLRSSRQGLLAALGRRVTQGRNSELAAEAQGSSQLCCAMLVGTQRLWFMVGSWLVRGWFMVGYDLFGKKGIVLFVKIDV